MKTCSVCKIDKSKSDYNKKSSTKDGLQTLCRSCSKMRSRRYYDDNTSHHKKVIYVRKNKQVNINRRYVYDYLLANPCVDCKENDPVVLEFDHIHDKKKSISRLIVQGYSVEAIKYEIRKCEVRCANCHRRKTAADFNHYRWLMGR